MKKYEPVACVTGASGMIGGSIARKLLDKSFKVRALTRNVSFTIPGVESFIGGLDNEDSLSAFLNGADFLFHCAAELKDESKMWEVNVLGTERLLKFARKSDVKYLCFISSVGVIGLTDDLLVDEQTDCNPQNAYEKSKLAAENLVFSYTGNCGVIILRPTNVINEQRPGVLTLPIRNVWLDRLAVLLKGGECAHIVHADDIADAAIYFIDCNFGKPKCYIVSCDHDKRNTYAGLWSLYNQLGRGNNIYSYKALHLPIFVPHILRSLKHGKVNKGNIRYSSGKLLSTGFKYTLGVEGAVKRIASYWKDERQNVMS